MKNRVLIPLLVASSLSTAAAQLIRYGFSERLGKYTLLTVGCFALLAYATARLCAGNAEDEQKIAQTLSTRLCGALTVTGGFLLAVPLLRFGTLLGKKIGYASFVPATLSENGIVGLLLFSVLPFALMLTALLGIAFPLLLRLGITNRIACPVVGLLAALLPADPLKGIVYFLLGTLLAFVALRVGRWYAILLGTAGSFLFTLLGELPFENAAPTVTKTVGMLLLFAGFTLVLWAYGGGYLAGRMPHKGLPTGILWIAAALLAVCGCAIIAYAG